jgi:hypothetical protein
VKPSREELIVQIEDVDRQLAEHKAESDRLWALRASLTARIPSTDPERTSFPFVPRDAVRGPHDAPPRYSTGLPPGLPRPAARWQGMAHPLRRPEIADEPIEVPLQFVYAGMTDEGFVWVDRGDGDRVMHVRHRWTHEGPATPLDCGAVIGFDDPRLVSVTDQDMLRNVNVAFCKACLKRLF